MWDRRARITNVHDGDTITAILDQGFGDTKEIRIRLLGVWAPELKQPGGIETRQFVLDWVGLKSGAAWPFIVTTIRLKNDTREITTLERYVCTVTALASNDNLNGAITDFVRAQGYGGGVGA